MRRAACRTARFTRGLHEEPPVLYQAACTTARSTQGCVQNRRAFDTLWMSLRMQFIAWASTFELLLRCIRSKFCSWNNLGINGPVFVFDFGHRYEAVRSVKLSNKCFSKTENRISKNIWKTGLQTLIQEFWILGFLTPLRGVTWESTQSGKRFQYSIIKNENVCPINVLYPANVRIRVYYNICVYIIHAVDLKINRTEYVICLWYAIKNDSVLCVMYTQQNMSLFDRHIFSNYGFHFRRIDHHIFDSITKTYVYSILVWAFLNASKATTIFRPFICYMSERSKFDFNLWELKKCNNSMNSVNFEWQLNIKCCIHP